MNVLECINSRKSVRSFTENQIPREYVEMILKAGAKAPSGKNGQPWRFYLVQRNKLLLREIAKQTVYSASALHANCLILVFLDKLQSYHYIKDVQAIGACIENILLASEELGIGACWNGEILRNDIKVKQLLSLDNRYDLMAMVMLGYPNENGEQIHKKHFQEELLGDE